MLLARVKSGGRAKTRFLGPRFSKTVVRAALRSSRVRSVVGEPWAKKVGIDKPPNTARRKSDKSTPDR